MGILRTSSSFMFPLQSLLATWLSDLLLLLYPADVIATQSLCNLFFSAPLIVDIKTIITKKINEPVSVCRKDASNSKAYSEDVKVNPMLIVSTWALDIFFFQVKLAFIRDQNNKRDNYSSKDQLLFRLFRIWKRDQADPVLKMGLYSQRNRVSVKLMMHFFQMGMFRV